MLEDGRVSGFDNLNMEVEKVAFYLLVFKSSVYSSVSVFQKS